jgi:hypothetical protein
MRRTTVMIAALGLIAGASLANMQAAQAQVAVASGPMYGGPSEITVQCYVANVSKAPVSLGGYEIIDESNAAQPITGNDCPVLPATLAAGDVCRWFTHPIVNIYGHYCRVGVAAPSVPSQIRGRIEVRDSAANILNSGEMQ